MFRDYRNRIRRLWGQIFPRERQQIEEDMRSDAVTWSYRLFLDREPENQATVAEMAGRLTSSQGLRQEFLGSEEFKQKNPGFYSPALSGHEPAMEIETVRSEGDLQFLFQHIQDTWQQLGETEPYWSVLAAEQFKLTNIQEARTLFYQSGQGDVSRFLSTLERNGIDRSALKSCLDYGCGLGRITRWLADSFEQVYGYDISQTHLRHAAQYLPEIGVQNVTLRQIKELHAVDELPKVDAVYSVIVLQHNPPPIIRFIVRGFLRALNAGGVAYFQVPTYRLGYRFSLKEYLREQAKLSEMEMHVLPQREIFELARTEGCKLVEVIEDSFSGERYKELSNTFLVQKE